MLGECTYNLVFKIINITDNLHYSNDYFTNIIYIKKFSDFSIFEYILLKSEYNPTERSFSHLARVYIIQLSYILSINLVVHGKINNYIPRIFPYTS